MCVRATMIDGRVVGLARRRSAASTCVVVHAVDALDVPAVRLEALADVLGERELGRAVELDEVGVVEARSACRALVAGKRRRLVRDALLQVAVAGEHVRVVVDDRRVRAG